MDKVCTNCLKSREDVFQVFMGENFYACPGCTVNYAKDRTGFAFMLKNEVTIKNGLMDIPFWTKCKDRVFVIKGIYIHEECESGRMIFLVDKVTGRNLKSMLDVNWLKLHIS